MKIKLTEQVVVAGVVKKAGEKVELRDDKAASLVRQGYAVYLGGAGPKKIKPGD